MKQVYRFFRRKINNLIYKLSPGLFFANLREAKNAPSIKLNIKNKNVILNPQNYYEWSYFNGIESKEEDTTEWIKSFDNGAVFYDVGANVGMYTILAMMYHDNLQVVSFEPECQNFSRLIANLHDSHFDRATAYSMGLSSENTLSYLEQVNPKVAGRSSSLAATSSVHGLVTMTMDAFTEKSQTFPNYIKVDVDGIEEMVLLGALKTLQDPRLKSVLVEVSETSRDACVQMMTNAGFKIKSVHPRNLNHIFVR